MSWTLQQLAKSQDDTMVVGICGGLGQHTPVPAWLWRAGMVVTAFAGAGVVVYGALWLFMPDAPEGQDDVRSEEHTSELQSLMRISYAVFCLKTKTEKQNTTI